MYNIRNKRYTEQEKIFNLSADFFHFTKTSKSLDNEWKLIDDLLPGWIHFNNSQTIFLEDIGNDAINRFEKPVEEIRKDGLKFFSEIIDGATLDTIQRYLLPFSLKGDKDDVCGVFQNIRYNSTCKFQNYYTISKIHSNSHLISYTVPIDNILNRPETFTQLLQDQEKFREYFKLFSLLTTQEKRITKLISQGINDSIIIGLLSISHHTLQTHKKNIYRKLNVNSLAQLLKIAKVLDL